ncbi:MAG: HD domain-containing protein [Fibrobacter sp.]|nr:HD domain-containing protein [Fibrobacter sp.]
MDHLNRYFSTDESVDYKDLFLKEQQKTSELQSIIEIQQVQIKTYSRELSGVYQQSKLKRKQIADTNQQLETYSSELRNTIANLKQTHHDLQDAYRDTIYRLVLASEYKDNDTGNHISRIGQYCMLLAEKLGLSSQDIENIGLSSPMHDVGKIGIPDSIILKNGMLTENEFAIIKTHTTIGGAILDNSKAAVLQNARMIALSHHEHWDGSGYPEGLSGENIPLHARIVALSDTFDALTSKRPYKAPYPIEVACDIIKKERGRHFDPDVVDVFLNSINSLVKIKIDIDNEDPRKVMQKFSWSERDKMYNPVN